MLEELVVLSPIAPGRRKTTFGRFIEATVATEGVSLQQADVNGANLGNQAQGSSSLHEVFTRDKLNKMGQRDQLRMENSQKALMDKLNALITLQSSPASRAIPEPTTAIE